MWFESLPPCEAQVPCGDATHAVRWEAGSVILPSHPDAEAELVLAALGGEKAGCVRLAEAWSRHTADPTVLTIGPRGAADQITVDWDTVQAAETGAGHAGWASTSMAGPGPGRGVGSGRFPMRPGHGSQHIRQAIQAEMEQARQRTTDHLALLALGSAFSMRLAGHVAAAHAEHLEPANRPTLTVAIEGRIAPLIEEWIGIDPDQVRCSINEDTGWGSIQLTGKGQDRRLHTALPPTWLADVWACGLTLVSRHLVVAVLQPGWPDTQVLALPTPAADPTPLTLHGTTDPTGTPHWELLDGK
jgi:hypothetical protein